MFQSRTSLVTPGGARCHRPGRLRLAAVALLGASVVAGIGLGGSTKAAAASATPWYMALGGSGSVGVQPTAASPRGAPTYAGYADDLLLRARAIWPGLQLVRLGCPGETTATMLDGGDRCYGAGTSQLSAALAFLHAHPTTRLVTVDLGFNDIRPCFMHESVDEACVSEGIATIDRQLPAVLSALRAATATPVAMLGVGHYDPYLADTLEGRGASRVRRAEHRRHCQARRHAALDLRALRYGHGRRLWRLRHHRHDPRDAGGTGDDRQRCAHL